MNLGQGNYRTIYIVWAVLVAIMIVLFFTRCSKESVEEKIDSGKISLFDVYWQGNLPGDGPFSFKLNELGVMEYVLDYTESDNVCVGDRQDIYIEFDVVFFESDRVLYKYGSSTYTDVVEFTLINEKTLRIKEIYNAGDEDEETVTYDMKKANGHVCSPITWYE